MSVGFYLSGQYLVNFFFFAASPGMMVHHQSQSDMHRDVIAVVKVTVFKLPQ